MEKFFSKASPDAFDMIKKCLAFNPKNRPTIE